MHMQGESCFDLGRVLALNDPPTGRKSGSGAAGKAKGKVGRVASSNGTLRLLVEAAMLRPRRVALRLPHGGWGRDERGGAGADGDRADPKERMKRKQTGGGGGGGRGLHPSTAQLNLSRLCH